MSRHRRRKLPTREEILRVLSRHREELRRRFRVKSLALFGSVARGEAGPTSDIDLFLVLGLKNDFRPGEVIEL